MIIYTYPISTAFTQRDIEMIRPHGSIRAFVFTNDPIKLPFYFILQFFQLLLFLPRTTKYLCFFAGYHSVLPVFFGKLFGISVFIQSGGMDAMNMPEINYGNFRKKWLRKATVYSLKHCSMILPVAEALVQCNYTYDPRINPKQGLKNLIPDLSTPIHVIHNGFDADFWVDEQKPKRPFSFITVAVGTSQANRAAVKGIDLILDMASRFPNYVFTLVGDPHFRSELPNVKVMGKLTPALLKEEFNQHRFYLQLSTSEGFPNALAEAMLCGCIPIGSAVGAIPEIIGNTGFLLQQKDQAQLHELFLQLPKEDLDHLRISARQRIQEHFSYEKRQKALLAILLGEKQPEGI
ncbi:MAG TPA: glycosyltransferase family 4 protein [Cyclobacteriaceae bacterium]|nr:glycosyltransferase family 4 protein [Cyclobacteriaceae bacterium]